MDTTKNRNSKDLTEAEELKKRWQEYTEEVYQKISYDLNNLDGVVTHLDPDILECEVKLALIWIKLVEVIKFQQLFQILNDNAVKALHLICLQIWKTQQWPQDLKSSIFILIPKKRNAKEHSNYHTIVLISHSSKIMIKILQARLQQYVNWEISDVKAGFRKGRWTRDQIANIHCIIKKTRGFQEKKKKNTTPSLTTIKPLNVWITTNCGKFLKRWE